MENKVQIINKFTFNEKEYELVYPTARITREAKMRQAKSFADAIAQGIPTKKKLEGLLKSGPINVMEEHNSRKAELMQQFQETQSKLNKATDPDEIDYLAELLRLYRASIIQEDVSINSLLSNTADQLAEEERVAYLAATLIRHKDENRVWESVDDFLEDNDYSFVEHCKYQIFCWEYNLSPDWNRGELPEDQALSRAQDIRAEKEKELVSTTEDIPNKVEKKKTRTRKKKSE